MNDNVKISATINWAYLNEVNEMSGKHQVDLCNLSDKAAAALEQMGIEVREKEGNGKFITCKSQSPIRAYDKDGMIVPADIKVGNGSKATVLIGSYEWKYKNKKGISPSIRKMVITDLVVYEAAGADMGEDEAL